MADEENSNDKFNETRSKSIIIRSPNGKQITKHTSIHITRLGTSASGQSENLIEPLTSNPSSPLIHYQSTSELNSNETRCKSTSPDRTKSSSALPTNRSSNGFTHHILPAIRRTCSSLQISVNISSPSTNDLFFQQPQPLPIHRSHTTFESSWILSSSTTYKQPTKLIEAEPVSVPQPVPNSEKQEDKTTAEDSSQKSSSSRIQSQVAIDIECGRKSDLSPPRVSFARETVSKRSVSLPREPTQVKNRENETNQTNEADSFEKVITIPIDGWTVQDAIEKGLLDPKTGTFRVTGSDHLINLKECCKLKIINPLSADVVDPSRPFARPANLNLAFERELIDEFGNYLGNERKRKISVKEALDKKYISFNEKIKTIGLVARKVIRITQSNGGQVKVTLEPESLAKSKSSMTEAKTSTSTTTKTVTTTTTTKSKTQLLNGKPQSIEKKSKPSTSTGYTAQSDETEIAFIDDEEAEQISEPETYRADDLIEQTFQTDLTVVEGSEGSETDENWSEIVAEINQRLELIKEYEKFQETYTGLRSWLREIEAKLQEIGPVGHDLKEIEAQRNKLSSLRSEFKQKAESRKTFCSTGEALRSKMDSSSDEYNQIISLINKFNEHWNLCETQWTEKDQKVKNLEEFCSNFRDKLSKLEDDLDALLSDLDDLKISETGAGDKASRLESISEQLTLQKSTITECEIITDHLYQLVSDTSKADDIRSKFNGVELKVRQLADEMQGLGQYLEKLETFESLWKEVDEWSNQVTDKLAEDLTISTDENDLKSELSSIESMKKEMQEKESLVRQLEQIASELVATGSNGPTSSVFESARVNQRLDRITETWTQMIKETEERKDKIESSLNQCVTIKSNLVNMDSWIDELEVDLSNLADLTLDKSSLEDQMKTIDRINKEMISKSKEFEIVANVNLDCFNVGVKEAREEIDGILSRWQEVRKDIEQRKNQLKTFLESLKSLEGSLDETQNDVALLEEKIETYAVYETSSVDVRLIERVQNLLETVSSLEKKAADLELNGIELCKKMEPGESQKASAAIVSQSKDLRCKTSEIRDKLMKRNDQLISAKTSIDKIQKGIDEVERQLVKWEESLTKLPAIVTRERLVLEKQKTETEMLRSELEKFSANIEQVKKTIDIEKVSLEPFEVTYRNFLHVSELIDSRRVSCLTSLNGRASKIETALQEAKNFEAGLKEFDEWLRSIETSLENMEEPSYLAETVEKQIQETNELQQSISSRREMLIDLERKGSKQEKDKLIGIRGRWNKLTSKATKRARTLDRNAKQAREFADKWTGLMEWLSRSEMIIESTSLQETANLNQMINDLRSLSREFDHKQSYCESVSRLGRSLKEKSPKIDQDSFRRLLDELKSQWSSCQKSCSETLSRLEKTLSTLERYRKLYKQLKEWSSEAVINLEKLQGDPETVQKLIRDHANFTKQLALKNDSMIILKDLADDLMNQLPSEQSNEIVSEISGLSDEWDELNAVSQEKESRLREALEQSESLKSEVNRMLNWLIEIETSVGRMKLDSFGTNGRDATEDEKNLNRYIDEVNGYIEKMGSSQADRDRIIAKTQATLLDCHPDANYTVRHYIELIESTWEDVASTTAKKEIELREKLDEIVRKAAFLSDLTTWLSQRESEFDQLDDKTIPNEIAPIQELIEEMMRHKETVTSRESDLDKIAMEYRKEVIPKLRSRPSLEKKSSNKIRAAEVPIEQISDSRAVDLIKRWRSLTSKIEDRLIRLRSKHNFYLELEKLRDFDFDSWRRRFIDWLDSRSSRLIDFYRKLDDNRDNKITREEFVEGFVRFKFPGTRSELQKVAVIFDRNNDGFIDSKEWMDKLKDSSEVDMIVSEMKKQSAECTCPSQYRVHQVEDKKYLFGESQKLRLVRILRSDIMVRVGGGWISLTEFLLKNDPCRAKGRTNVELREPLADGVSQGMASFQSKSTFFCSNQYMGPITNIREKTERSVPMSVSADHHHHHHHDVDEDDDSLNGLRVSRSSRPPSRLTFIAKDDRCPSRGGFHDHSRSQERKFRIDPRPVWH